MVNCDSTREVELSLIRDICDLRGDTGAINEEQWKQPANRNRRIGSNDRFFPLSKRGWGARGILRLAQLSFLSSIKQVGSNARSRVELLPHPVRSVASRSVADRSFRGSPSVPWIDRAPRDPLSQGGPKKTVRSSFSPTFHDFSRQLSRSLRCRFGHFYRVLNIERLEIVRNCSSCSFLPYG